MINIGSASYGSLLRCPPPPGDGPPPAPLLLLLPLPALLLALGLLALPLQDGLEIIKTLRPPTKFYKSLNRAIFPKIGHEDHSGRMRAVQRCVGSRKAQTLHFKTFVLYRKFYISVDSYTIFD